MKLIKIIIQHILIPLATILFIIGVGLSAAGISALIEYCVLEEMFSSKHQQLLSSATIALLLVAILEFSKIYLHFLRSKLNDASKPHKMAKWILPFLVGISILCTVIFCVSTFHLASYDDASIQAEIKRLDAQLDEDIEKATSTRDEEYKIALQPYITTKENAHVALQNFNPRGLTSSQREIKLKALQAAVETADKAYVEEQKRLAEQRDQNIESDIASLRTATDKKIDKLSNLDAPEIAAQYDNPILAQFLDVLAQILFNANTYSRSVYLVVTILFSILIAVLLECIITICFHLISYPLETLIDTTTSITPTLQAWCNNLILTALKAVCAMFISIVIITATPTKMDKFQFMTAAFSCGLSILLVQHFVSDKTGANEGRSQLLFAIRDAVLEGVLSFMGYILLGFLLGKDALTLDVQTFAIGIGTSLSGFIGYVPKYLNNRLNHLSTS